MQCLSISVNTHPGLRALQYIFIIYLINVNEYKTNVYELNKGLNVVRTNVVRTQFHKIHAVPGVTLTLNINPPYSNLSME